MNKVESLLGSHGEKWCSVNEKGGLVWHLCKVLGGFLKSFVIEN